MRQAVRSTSPDENASDKVSRQRDKIFNAPNLKIKQPGSHFDHLLRQTRMHHQQLSVMADSKANMLITISSVVLTLSVPLLLEPSLRFTALALIISALITVLLASYAIMPKHISANLNKTVPGNTPRNLLFFGHFVHMPYEDYEAAWQELLNDPNMAYQVQVEEIYGLGCYLAAYKYRYLRFAYFSFLTGIVIAGTLAVAPVLMNMQ